MARKIGAFIAFNVYSFFLISAFEKNVPYLFDAKILSSMRERGLQIDIGDWGWNDHYIWRLFASAIVTALAAFLAGAIVRDKGGKIAAISNIPSILIWMGFLYLMVFGHVKVAGQTGFAIISLLSIPLTSFVAYFAGNIGEEVQNTGYGENSVLGIHPYHWIWLIFPIYLYGIDLVFVVTKFLALQMRYWSNKSIWGTMISMIALLPVIAWIYPIRLIYKVLSGELLSESRAAVRVLANCGIFIGGALLGTGAEIACYWLLNKIL